MCLQSKEILNYVPAIGYSILLLLFMIFYLVAKWKESIQDRPKGLQEKMHLMATFLYHFMKKKKWLISSGKVRTDLMAVVPQKKIGEATVCCCILTDTALSSIRLYLLLLTDSDFLMP